MKFFTPLFWIVIACLGLLVLVLDGIDGLCEQLRYYLEKKKIPRSPVEPLFIRKGENKQMGLFRTRPDD